MCKRGNERVRHALNLFAMATLKTKGPNSVSAMLAGADLAALFSDQACHTSCMEHDDMVLQALLAGLVEVFSRTVKL